MPSLNKRRYSENEPPPKKIKMENDDFDEKESISRFHTPNYGKLIITEYHQIFEYDMGTAIYLHNKVHKGGFLSESFRLFSDMALCESPAVYMGSKFKNDLSESFKPKFEHYKEFIKQLYPYIFSIGMFAYKFAWEPDIDSYVPIVVPIESGKIISVLDPSNPKKKYYWVWNNRNNSVTNKKNAYESLNPSTSGGFINESGMSNDIKGSFMNSRGYNGNVLYHDPDVIVHVISAPRDLRDDTFKFLAMQFSEKSSSNDKAMACEMLQNQFTSDMASILIDSTRYNKMMESQVEIETKKTSDNVYVETRIPFETDKYQRFIELYKSERESIDDIANKEQLKELFDPYTSDMETRSKQAVPYAPIPLSRTNYGGTMGQYMQRSSEYNITNDGSVTMNQDNAVPIYNINNSHIHGSTGFDVPSSIYWEKKSQDAKITRIALANASIDSQGIFGDPKITPDGKMTIGSPLQTFKFAPNPSGGRSDLSDIVQMYNYQMSSLFGLPAVHSMSSNQTTARGRDIDKNVSESKISSILDAIKKIIEEVLNTLYSGTGNIINEYRKNLLLASKKKLYGYLERELMNNGIDYNHLIVLKDDYSSELNTFEGGNSFTDPFESLVTPEMMRSYKKSRDELRETLTRGVFADNPEALNSYKMELDNMKYLSNKVHMREESTIRIELQKKKDVDIVGMVELFKVGLLPKMDAAIEAMRQFNMDDTQSYKELVKMSETTNMKGMLEQFLNIQQQAQVSQTLSPSGGMTTSSSSNKQNDKTISVSTGNKKEENKSPLSSTPSTNKPLDIKKDAEKSKEKKSIEK